MSGLINYENAYGGNSVEEIIKDLREFTGLNLELDDRNYLVVGESATDSDATSGKISNYAKEFILSIIDSSDVVRVFGSDECSTYDNMVGMNFEQVTSAIENTHGVDKRTMGFGMTFLHELHHTSTGGGLPDTNDINRTGPVVDKMNKVRKELSTKDNDFGQRMIYMGLRRPDDAMKGYIVPFSHSALSRLQRGIYDMRPKDKYVITDKLF